MRTRELSYAHYGITAEERNKLLKLARQQENARLVKIAAAESNPDLSEALFISLTENKGYDRLSMEMDLWCMKDDFCAYKRRAVFLFKMLLLCEDTLFNIGKVAGIKEPAQKEGR